MKSFGHVTRHAYSLPRAVGARIVAQNGISPGLGSAVGDAILINLSRNVFAVADSPDSNPLASRNFLHAFNRVVENLAATHPNLWHDVCELESLKRVISDSVNRLIQQVDYRSATTFSCVMIAHVQETVRALVLHSGDSCIFKIEVEENSIDQVSWSSINHVGRASGLSQVEMVEVRHSTRFVLCTDGLHALARNPERRTLREILLEAGSHPEVHEVPGLVMEQYGRLIDLPDDVALIALDPHRLPRTGETIVQGGEE